MCVSACVHVAEKGEIVWCVYSQHCVDGTGSGLSCSSWYEYCMNKQHNNYKGLRASNDTIAFNFPHISGYTREEEM